MSNDISIAKENIYSFPSQFDFFKQNDLQSACYKLTCGIEEIFLSLLSTQMVMTDFDRIKGNVYVDSVAIDREIKDYDVIVSTNEELTKNILDKAKNILSIIYK